MYQKIILSLVILISSLNAGAASLREYRQKSTWQSAMVGSSAIQASADKQKRIENLVKALGFNTNSIPAINSTDRSPGTNRLSSSIFIKVMLEEQMRALVAHQLNPSFDAIDLNISERTRLAKLDFFEMKKIAADINEKFQDPKRRLGGLSVFLESLIAQVIIPESQESQSNFKENLNSNPSKPNQMKLQLIAQVNQFLNTLGANSGGLKVTDLLGEVVDLEYSNGSLKKMIFEPKKQKLKYAQKVFRLELSLPMLLNFRSYQDDSFLKILKGLVRYFALQQDIFLARSNLLLGEKNRILIGLPSVNNWSSRIRDAYTLAPEEDHGEIRGADLKARFFAELNYYLEGKKLNTPEEKMLISDRLKKLQHALPFLRERSEGAERSNSLLSSLNEKQLNGMLAFLLIQQKEEILSSDEFKNLPKFLELEKQQVLAQGTQSDEDKRQQNMQVLLRDFFSIKLVNNQISDLFQVLLTEKKLQKTHQEELSRIRKE